MCNLLGRPDLPKDPRYVSTPMRSQNRKDLRKLMFELYAPWKQRKKADVLKELRAINVPSGAVNNIAEVFADLLSIFGNHQGSHLAFGIL